MPFFRGSVNPKYPVKTSCDDDYERRGRLGGGENGLTEEYTESATVELFSFSVDMSAPIRTSLKERHELRVAGWMRLDGWVSDLHTVSYTSTVRCCCSFAKSDETERWGDCCCTSLEYVHSVMKYSSSSGI